MAQRTQYITLLPQKQTKTKTKTPPKKKKKPSQADGSCLTEIGTTKKDKKTQS